jgi:hypothetical protein
MEKIKTNYLLLSIFTLFFSFTFYIFIKIKNEYWWAIFFTFIPIIYIYIIENYTKAGCYFSNDGISIFKNEQFICTQWDQVFVKKSIWGIIIKFDEEKFNIDISRNHSALELVKKYCPQDHELYKLVEEYQKK